MTEAHRLMLLGVTTTAVWAWFRFRLKAKLVDSELRCLHPFFLSNASPAFSCFRKRKPGTGDMSSYTKLEGGCWTQRLFMHHHAFPGDAHDSHHSLFGYYRKCNPRESLTFKSYQNSQAAPHGSRVYPGHTWLLEASRSLASNP